MIHGGHIVGYIFVFATAFIIGEGYQQRKHENQTGVFLVYPWEKTVYFRAADRKEYPCVWKQLPDYTQYLEGIGTVSGNESGWYFQKDKKWEGPVRERD